MNIVDRLRIAKQKIMARVDFGVSYINDAYRFYCHSQAFVSPRRSLNRSRALLILQAHALEKGMAMPKHRPGFGEVKAEELLMNWRRHIALFGSEQFERNIASTLLEFVQFKRQRLSESSIIAVHELELQQSISLNLQPGNEVGLVTIKRNSLLDSLPPDPELFFTMRRSLRQFSSEVVPRDLLERAVRIAQRSPSVCNRQSSRVYLFDDQELKLKVLAIQSGNLGFGHTASFVAIVTSRLACFTSYNERNQAFVDGGIFFMGLLLAFHSLGIGCCSLNWAATMDQDRTLRNTAGIPDDEVIISLMCGGFWPAKAEVAASPRRELSDVLTWNPLKVRS